MRDLSRCHVFISLAASVVCNVSAARFAGLTNQCGAAKACLRLFAASLVIAASLAGCASVRIGDAQQDATLTTFAVAPDRAGVFIYRNESQAINVKTAVFLDGAPLGRTDARTYLYAEVAPGQHTVTSVAENIATLEVTVEPGALAFVWQEFTVSWPHPRNQLHLVNESQGREGVRETRLAPSKFPMQAVEVRVEAEDAHRGRALDCMASNSFGSWPSSPLGLST